MRWVWKGATLTCCVNSTVTEKENWQCALCLWFMELTGFDVRCCCSWQTQFFSACKSQVFVIFYSVFGIKHLYRDSKDVFVALPTEKKVQFLLSAQGIWMEPRLQSTCLRTTYQHYLTVVWCICLLQNVYFLYPKKSYFCQFISELF